MSSMRLKAIEGISVGDKFTVSRTFTEQHSIDFAEISRDYNPVHLDERFAKVRKLKGRICHGLLVASMLTEIGGQLGWLATQMDLKFEKPVYFGDTIECELTVTHIATDGSATAQVVFKNSDGTTVLKALIKGVVAGESEKQVMRTMMAEGDPTNKI